MIQPQALPMHLEAAHCHAHRLDDVQPYASLAVRKLTRTLAIGKRDGDAEPVRD